MEPLPKLSSKNIDSILQSLLAESTREIDNEMYNSQWHKHRLAYIRQSLRCCELFIEHERFNEIEQRLDRLTVFASDIKTGMFSDEAAEFIRSRNVL